MTLLPEILSRGNNRSRIQHFDLSRPCSRRTVKQDSLSVNELATLLEDRTFVDYFNVFLSLPVFYQKILYRYTEKDFEFDPPIKRRHYVLDKGGLIKWILSERLPFFLRSDLYLEFLLNSELLKTSQNLTNSSQTVKDEIKLIKEKDFIIKHLGHVIGMQQFRRYLEESLRLPLYEFWMDAERFSRILHNNHDARWDAYREMQIRYFKVDGLVKLEDNEMWSILSESFTCYSSVDDNHTCSKCTRNNKFIPADTFKPLQQLLLGILKGYWLQKYLIHCRCVELISKIPDDETIRMRSLSDLRIIKEMKNLEQAISLMEGNLRKDTTTKKRKALASWKAMFPDHKIDDSFLQFSDEVITQHADGKVSVSGGNKPPVVESLGDVTDFSSSEERAKCESDDSDDPASEPVIKILDYATDQEPSELTAQNLLLFDRLTTFCPLPTNLTPEKKKDKLPLGLNLKKPSMTRSFVLPPITESKKETPGRAAQPEIVKLGEAKITQQDLKFTNRATGAFRYDNRLLVGSVAADFLAGSPMEEFCSTDYTTKAFHFWQDAQLYIGMKNHVDNACEQLRFRRARKLCIMYLREDHTTPLLPPELSMTLLKVLPKGKGQDLLRHAQDIVTVDLRRRWKQFRRKDESEFVRLALAQKEKDGKGRLPAISKSTRRKILAEASAEEKPDDMEDDVDPGLAEKRSWCALHIASDISRYGEDILPPDPLPYECQERFDPDNDEGSLCIKTIRTVTRRDIEVIIAEQEERKKKLRAQMAANRAAEERQKSSRLLQTRQEEKLEDIDLTFLDKPIRKNRQWIHRPGKPRHFMELLRCSKHLEYFKRYLARNHADFPLLFWMAVENLKKIKEVKKRQQRVLSIVKTYFNKQDIAKLDCAAQVVMQIPNLERITPAVLMSAQTFVIRGVEEKWFFPYLETFVEDITPEIKVSHHGSSRRTWSKERTRSLWITFVRTFICFRRSIHHPIHSLLFRNFLKQEISRDVAKNQLSPSMGVAGNSILKKVIRNRLVSVDRLISDLGFVIESDKYLTFCDNVRHAATTGTYKPEDEDLLEMKAKAIVECYINSEVPPRLQVNIPQDMANTIIETYEQRILERGLFHDAMMATMPVVMQLWKKFQARRFVLASKKSHLTLSAIDTVLKNVTPPDFLHMSTEGKRIKLHHSDDEHPRILFSLSQGLRYLIPTLRDDTSRSPGGRVSRLRRGTIGVYENISHIDCGSLHKNSMRSSISHYGDRRKSSQASTLKVTRGSHKTANKTVVLEEDEEGTDSVIQIPTDSMAVLRPEAGPVQN